MSLQPKVKSPSVRMWLQEARALWTLKKFDSAAASALKAYRAEGREIFTVNDAPLLAAALARASAEKKKKAPR